MKIKYTDGTSEYNYSDISRIVIYGHGEELFTSEYGYFESSEHRTTSSGAQRLDRVYNGDTKEITLEKKIKRAVKKNLGRNDNFVLNYSPDYLPREIRKALYIHESEIAVIDLGAVLAMETDEEKNYLHACKLSFRHPVVFQRLHAEKIPCDGNWTLPEGGRWSSGYGTAENPCFDTYDHSKSIFAKRHGLPMEKGVIKRWYTWETVENAEIISTERYYIKTEYSAERLRKNAVADALNASGLFRDRFSHYDINKLEKVLGRLTVKEG